MDSNLPEGDKQGKQKYGQRKAKAIDESGNESIQEKSVKIEQVLDLIKHLGLTEEELCRLRKNLSDRNHRAHTKAEKEGYKTLAELRAKDVEQMLEMYNSFKAEKEKFKDVNKKMKAENKEMEAKIWELQKEMEDLRKVAAENQMTYSDDQLFQGSGNHQGGSYLGSAPQSWGGPNANTAFDVAASAPVMIPGNEQFVGMQGPRKLFEDHKPFPEGIYNLSQAETFTFEELLSGVTNPQINGTQNNSGASTSAVTLGNNQYNKVDKLEQMFQNQQNQISELMRLIRGNSNV